MTRPWPPDGGDRSASSAMVTAVLCAALDAPADDAVLAVRDQLIRAGTRLPSRPRHRPHLTLAAARAHTDQLPAVVDAVAAMAAPHRSFGLPLTRIGSFAGARALWLGPAEVHGPPALQALQRSAVAMVAGSGWEPAFAGRSRAAEWVAHCSLATRLPVDRLSELRALIAADYEPIDATVAGVAIIVVGAAGDAGLIAL